jgi:hypothetical protein
VFRDNRAATPRAAKSWLDRLPADIFGSDVFVDYGHTYVWQANQVGHFAIGFAAASLVAWFVAAFHGDPSITLWIGGALIPVYAGKEYLDLLIAQRQAQDFYPYRKSELWADMAADTWFVASGVLTLLASVWWPVAGLVVAGIVVAVFFVLRSVFLPAKKSIDRSGLPYVYRLSNFPRTEGVLAYNATRLRAFITDRPAGGFDPSPAVLIQGYRGTGKTLMAVGIGSEVAIGERPPKGACGRTLYRTAFSLFEEGAPPGDMGTATIVRRHAPLFGTPDRWKLDDAEYVIIDDIDSDGGPYGDYTPDAIIDHLESRAELRDALKRKKTVWVTGTTEFESEDAPQGWLAWMQALARLYGCPIDDTRQGDDPTAIQAREPIPVIWLRQEIEAS